MTGARMDLPNCQTVNSMLARRNSHEEAAWLKLQTHSKYCELEDCELDLKCRNFTTLSISFLCRAWQECHFHGSSASPLVGDLPVEFTGSEKWQCYRLSANGSVVSANGSVAGWLCHDLRTLLVRD